MIADTGNFRIRQVNSIGVINTIAGNGTYRFSGDGGPASSASLNGPFNVRLGGNGDLYITDTGNSRVRKIDSTGVINTFAGNGSADLSGDGGPATKAGLSLTEGSLAIDATGNVFVPDYANNRVREVDPPGTITTVAGNGCGQPAYGCVSGNGLAATSTGLAYPNSVVVDAGGNLFIDEVNAFGIWRVDKNGVISIFAGNGILGDSGDGGPATSASINLPDGMIVDANGNLIFAERDGAVIRKVDPDGIISTIAGNGVNDFEGDGGPGNAASFFFPSDVASDGQGNLFVADRGNNRIRKISSDGTVSTVIGDGTAASSGDGGLAKDARVNGPTGLAFDAGGNLYIAEYGGNRVRKVLAAPPYFNDFGQPAGLSAPSGGRATSENLVVSTSVTAQSTAGVPGMSYSATVTTGASWLSVTPQSGSTPGLLTVKADPFTLAPGSYAGAITVTVPQANPSVRTVNVQFAVGPGSPPAIAVDQSHMSFTYATTSSARNQTLIVSNSGGGSLNFTTSILLTSGVSANWLSVTPQSGTATPGDPVALAVRADPSNLPPGTYTGSVSVQGGSAGSVTIPVVMTITTNPLVLLLSQTGLTFTAVQNGGAFPAQTFGVLNLGSGTLNWTVQTSTLTGGNWLSATPGTGSSTAAAPGGAPLVTVSVNPSGLQPGAYYGLVKVVSSGAANTPQEVVAVLQVLPAGTDVAPIVQPNSLIFTSPVGTSSPSSQNMVVYDPTGTSKGFRSGIVTVDGANWLVTLPSDATISPTQPTQVVVQPIVNGLNPGTYTGTLTLQFSDGRVSTVGITFLVTSAGASGSSGSSVTTSHAVPFESGSSTCTPTKLIPVLTTLGSGFTVPAGYPEGLTAQVADDCGTPLTQGKVSVEFSTGEGVQYMQTLNNGRWDVTWVTGSQQAAQVTLTVHAEHPTLPIVGDAQISGALGAPPAAPQVSDGGVVTAANFTATPLSPGSIISIFGSQLSDGTSPAPVLPLSTELDNATVRIGDALLPLFFTSTGQLNALVPYETVTNTNQQLLVQRDNTYATPVYVDVAAAQPGVLQYGQQEAIATDVNGNLIGLTNPAHAGDVLVMYCLGLGAVTPAVADGAAAPSNPPASTVNPVTVTVGNQTANVVFAGLTPMLAGLYQVNFQVPAGAPTGDQVPVILSIGGQMGAAVNLSVR